MPKLNFSIIATTTEMSNNRCFMRILINAGSREVLYEPPLALQYRPASMRDDLVNLGAKFPAQESGPLDIIKKRIIDKLDSVPALEAYKPPGWKSGNAFVMPGATYAVGDSPVATFSSRESDSAELLPSGTLEKWKSIVGAITSQSNYAIFVIALALAGPILDPLGEDESIFINLWNSTSKGKSSVVVLGMSVYEKAGRDRLFTFDHTDRAAEETLATRNHLFAPIDELGMAKKSAQTKDGIRKKSMTIAGGSGTKRSKSVKDQLPNEKWLLTGASTANRPVMLGKPAGEMDPAAVRWLDIRVWNIRSSGILDKIEGDVDVRINRKLIRGVLRRLRKNHGTLGREWIGHLVHHKAKAVKTIRAFAEEFITENVRNEKTEEGRVAEKFAQISAVSQYAALKGFVPWTVEDAKNACAIIYKRYLKDLGKCPKTHRKAMAELLEMVKQRDGLPSYGSEKWRVLTQRPAEMIFGFVKKNCEGGPRLFLFTGKLRMLSKRLGLKADELEGLMAANGLFMLDAQDKPTRAEALPWQSGKLRMHVISIRALKKYLKSQDA